MIIWEIVEDNGEGQKIYKRIDEDGVVRVTAIQGYPELDEWLEANLPEVKETPETPEAEEN